MAKKAVKTEWQNRITGYDVKPASWFLANEDNWRIHPKPQADGLEGVLQVVGWVQDVIVNLRTSPEWGTAQNVATMVDGHLRVTLALRQGEDTPVPLKYVDLTPAEEALVLASLDPLGAMAATDKTKLDDLLRMVQSDDARVQAMIADLAEREGLEYGRAEPADDPGAEIDRAEELREKWGVNLGDLWELGTHRLVCGDCTDRAVVERVMGGEKAGAVVTDPPYGQNQLDVPNDEPENNLELLIGCVQNIPVDNGIIVAFQSPRTFPNWMQAIHKHKFLRALWLYKEAQMANPWRGWILKSEMILMSEIGNGEWLDVHPFSHDCYKVSEVSYRTEQIAAVRPHGSVKPLAIVQDLVSRIGGVVYDPFLGSGTTLIACERLGRKCRACEISPAYVAVALERYFQMTGQNPRLVDVS